MPNRINIIGRQFGKLKVIAEAPPRIRPNGKPLRMSVCVCECGKEITTQNQQLTSGHTASCGCSRSEGIATHGHARREGYGGKSRTYHCWRNMIRRCTQPTNTHYDMYGGRGITVCGRWMESFENFLADLGEAPAGMSIDRIDTNGNYEVGNVKWSTVLQQAQNTRRALVFTVQGITGSLSLLCRHFQIKHYATVRRRVSVDGWDAEKAMFTPPSDKSDSRKSSPRTHGHAKRGERFTKAYRAWRTMLRRCRDTKLHNYKNYGGRGIAVCERWNDFTNFLADMGECPENGSLRRKNTDGNYEKDNCEYVLSPS